VPRGTRAVSPPTSFATSHRRFHTLSTGRARADDLFNTTGTEYIDALLGLAACDPAQARPVDNVWKRRWEVAKLVGGETARVPLGTDYDAGALLASLMMLDRAGIGDLRSYLKRIAPDYGDGPRPTVKLLSPWSMLASDSDYARMPAAADAVAARLIKLADEWKPPPKPKRRKPDDDDGFRDFDVDSEALADPRPYLRWAAVVLEIEATVGYVRRGDEAAGHVASFAAFVQAYHPDTVKKFDGAVIVAAPALHLAGRSSDVIAALDMAVALVNPDDTEASAVFAVQRALIQIQIGAQDKAWVTLDPAVAAFTTLEPRTRWNVAWVRAALALMLNKPLDVPLPELPAKREFELDRPDLNLAYWYTAATLPATQRDRRWQSDGVDPGWFDNVGVLPAQLYVIGKAAGAGDVELWLDIVTANEITDWQALASAREEAARWRGDTAAADAWRKRLATMRALATDDRSAYLIDIALEN
jgi:hypothetical protein